MDHATTVNYEGGLKQLAEDLGNLRYDALEDFLQHLQEKLWADYQKDKDRGNVKLAAALKECAIHVEVAQEMAGKAWKISKPHMKPKPNPEAHAPLNDVCEKCGRVYCDHEEKY